MSDSPAMLGVVAYGRAAARLGRASRAAVLSKEGASPRRILLETGYQRGPYGWGVETRGDVYLKPASAFGARPSGTLEEMADVHPDVERAYPGIGRELRVEVVPDNAWADRVAAARKSLALWASHGDTASGFYDRGNHLIAVRAQMPGETMNGYIDRADGTVTHEVQHYAQERDGLRPSGPRRHVDADDYREDGLEVDARNSAARRKLTPEERREMPRLMTQDVKPEDVRRDDKGGDALEGFARWLGSMPAARIDVPEERARLAARADQRRRDRVANMYANIRLHEAERQARARENHALALAKRDAALAAQRDALERASAARPGPADRARHERADFMKQIGADQGGTIYVNTVTDPVLIGVDGVARPASQSQMEDARRSRHLDDKGGDNFGTFRNFLATDDVPESIFGIPVVQDESQYTEKDLEFFRKNPKAAGFYDLGDEEPEPSPDGGGGSPSADLKGGISGAVDKLKGRIGETGEVLDYGIAWMERQAKQTADMGVPVLSKFADAVVQPALVGTRAAIANATSGGGKYYQPEVRDERYFSQASLRQLGQAMRKNGGKGTSRDDFDIGTAGGFGVANTVGGSAIVGDRLTDKFDVDAHDPYGMTTVKVVGKPLELLHRALGAVVGSGDDPDAGKIRTSIPLTALDLRLDDKGGKAIEAPTLSDDRPMHIFRDDSGKVAGYGTTRSMVHEQDGRYYVIPTILADSRGGTRVADDGEAVRHFRSTREHWGGYADRQSAEDAAEAVHERHQRLYGKKWNDYIQDHWDEMSDEIRSDPGVLDARHARTRGAYPGKLNNPGNVEKRKERRRGEVDSPSERFAKFATPQDGLREMADAIRQIAEVKLAEKGQAFTVRNFAEVYAPRYNEKGEVENDTDKYIADISADSEFAPDEELHRFDGGDMARLLKSVVRFESGAPHSAWFTDEEYAEAAKKLQEGAVD